MLKSLPARPSLEQHKKQAKELLDAIRNQQPDALALFAEHHPLRQQESAKFALHDAQLVHARSHGFASWPKLKEEIERRTATLEQRADRLVIDARDTPDRARRALEVEPELANANWWTQLATGNVAAIQDALKRDATLVSKPGGPCADGKTWLPLHYICFSRLQEKNAETKARFTECARALLDAGADINATEGNQPRNPLSGSAKCNNSTLARFLLERGANTNNGYAVYQAARYYHLEILEIFQEFGVSPGVFVLPEGEASPLHLLINTTTKYPEFTNVHKGIRWVLDHECELNTPTDVFRGFWGEGQTPLTLAAEAGSKSEGNELVRWLLEAGADANRVNRAGMAPITIARRVGRKDVADLLKEHGAKETVLKPKEKFFESVFSGNKSDMLTILEENPKLFDSFDEDDHQMLHIAAYRGNAEAIHLLLDAGFDAAYQGKYKSTALHNVAWSGETEAVEVLIARGAPVNIRETYLHSGKSEGEFPLDHAVQGSTGFRNPKGDYPRIVRALLAAGAKASPEHLGIGSPEVEEIIVAALAEKNG